MLCWKCRSEIEGNLLFKTICDACLAWQHCCRNCKHYKPGMPNDCLIPDTEFVADREGANYCDEFSVTSETLKPKDSLDDVSKRLFGDESDHKPKGFDDLFS